MSADTLSTDFLLFDKEEHHPNSCPHCGQESSKISAQQGLLYRAIRFMVYSTIILSSVIGVAFFSISSRSQFFPISKVELNEKPSLYSPVSSGIRYQIETSPFDYWSNNLYVGEPNDESEMAWNKLIHPAREHSGIRLLRKEGTLLDIDKSLRLTDGNLAVLLGVHHNLHCLRRLRQALYEDHYYPNLTEKDQKHNREHNLHCIETLRTSMICRPDLAPLPYYLSGNTWHDLTPSPQVKRECVKWDFFSEYLKSRSYDESELIRDHS